MPCTISTTLINSILIPVILYKLQVTPTQESKIESIQAQQLRQIVKSKFGLSQNHKADVLQDKNYGINLMQLQDKLDQQSLNNISTHIISESTTGTILRAAIKVASRNAIKNILQCPISSTKITTNTNNLIADISRKLVKYDINLRNPKEKTEGNIALNMAPKEYNRHWEDLMRYRITKYTDIQAHNRQTTKSFNAWIQTITKPTRQAKHIEQIFVLEWYQAILRTIDPTINNIDLNRQLLSRQLRQLYILK
jgi:hypothetical protein